MMSIDMYTCTQVWKVEKNKRRAKNFNTNGKNSVAKSGEKNVSVPCFISTNNFHEISTVMILFAHQTKKVQPNQDF